MKTSRCGKFASFFFCFYNPFARVMRFLFVEKKKERKDPSAILLCCWASLGDLFLATSVLPSIQAKWPKVKVGFLCAPDSCSVLENIQGIDFVHKIPSWLNCRKGKIYNLFSFFCHSLFVYPKMIAELKKVNYDIAIELYPFFPGSLALMRRARISRRVGFLGSGHEVWLTDPVVFPDRCAYLPCLYGHLLKVLDVEEVKIVKPKACLDSKTVILHMGSSDPRKEWQPCHWEELARFLQNKGYHVVFTGKGIRDQKLIGRMQENLCDKLSFQDLVTVICRARLLISVDSVPIHIAAAYGVPFVGLYLYNKGVELWLPDVTNCHLFIGEKAERRCKEKIHACATYKSKIQLHDVLEQVNKLLGEF